MSVRVDSSPVGGRGVFAERTFGKGTVVMRAPLIVMPKDAADLLDRTALADYYFNGEDGEVILALGLASLLNHADDPNLALDDYSDDTFSFRARRPIRRGEELTIHYNNRPGTPATLWFPTASLEFVTDGRRHLVCRPYSIENLHRMAEGLSISRAWFHRDHYDIPKRRIADIESRCTLVSPRELLSLITQRKRKTTPTTR